MSGSVGQVNIHSHVCSHNIHTANSSLMGLIIVEGKVGDWGE